MSGSSNMDNTICLMKVLSVSHLMLHWHLSSWMTLISARLLLIKSNHQVDWLDAINMIMSFLRYNAKVRVRCVVDIVDLGDIAVLVDELFLSLKISMNGPAQLLCLIEQSVVVCWFWYHLHLQELWTSSGVCYGKLKLSANIGTCSRSKRWLVFVIDLCHVLLLV